MALSENGNTFLIEGCPGTGKSKAASTILNVEGVDRALILGTKQRELASFGYDDPRFVKERFIDAKWRPSIGMFEADAFVKLLHRLFDLYEDDLYDAVIIDAGTDAYNFAGNELRKVEKAPTPRDMRDSRGYYGALKAKSKELTEAVTALAYASRPKHVIMTMHTQPAKEDEASQKKGIEFEGSVMAAIEGGHRDVIAGDFDVVLFTDIKNEKKLVNGKMQESTSYVLQIRPDHERHAKVALGPLLDVKEIPNDLGVLFAKLAAAGATR